MRGGSFLLALVAAGLAMAAGPAAAACKLGRLAELPVTMNGLVPMVAAKIDGADVRLIADTGAFFSMLTPPSAARLGLKPRPLPVGFTVKGLTGQADVRMTSAKTFTILGVPFKNSDFLVGGSTIASEADGLLGQNFLGSADVEFDLAHGVIRLFRPDGCGGAEMAYWLAPAQSYSVVELDRDALEARRLEATAKVNGADVYITFDTGSPTSMLTMRGARRAGVNPQSEGVIAGGMAGGIGRRQTDSWLAPFKSFKIGDEEIQNTRLRLAEIEMGNADMVIGADFFLSHRIYVSKSQDKIYFSYNGGPVFNLERGAAPQPAAPVSTASAVLPPGADSGEPKDAADFQRRGAASAARRDFTAAIADFTRAVEFEPTEAQYVYDRGMARLQNRQPVLAMLDFDQALKLKPDDVAALMMRGRLRLDAKDEAGAHADFDAALKLDPSLRPPIADAYGRAGLFEAAIPLLDQWIAANPKDDRLASILNQRCWTRAIWGHELDKALADCDAALKLTPHTSNILDSRGLVRLRLGQVDGALADYNESIRLQPRNGWSLYGRGLAELRQGKTAEGDADLKASAAIAPHLPEFAAKNGIAP